MSTTQCSLKVFGFPPDVTKEQLKIFFKAITGSDVNPTVAIEKPGTAIIVFQNSIEAKKALKAKLTINGTTFHAFLMPPPFLGDTRVVLKEGWTTAFNNREDVRQKLKEENISTHFEKGKWVFTGNYYNLQVLHRLLDDVVPMMQYDESSSDDFEIIEAGPRQSNGLDNEAEMTVAELSDETKLSNAMDISDSEDKEYDVVGDDLYADDQTEPEAKHVSSAVKLQVGLKSSLEHSEEGASTHSGLETPADVEDTQIAAVNKTFTDMVRAKTKSAESSLSSEPEKATADERGQSGRSLPSAPPAEEAYVIVSAGVFEFIKNRRANDLESIVTTFNVNIKRSSFEGKYDVKIRLTPKDRDRPAMLQQAQKRLELLCREVDLNITKKAFSLGESLLPAHERSTILNEIATKFPDITLCQRKGDVLLVGDNQKVEQATNILTQHFEKMYSNTHPERLLSTDRLPSEAAVDHRGNLIDDERNQLVQLLLDKGAATQSVLNDIYSNRNLGGQSPRHDEQQPTSDEAFPLRDEDFVRIAEQSNIAGAPVVSLCEEEPAHADSTCSFCGEADASTLTKLRGCNHLLCALCMEPAKAQGFCPVCEEPLNVSTLPFGTQPKGGKMTEEVSPDKMYGFEDSSEGTIVITYDIPDGIQTQDHPHPGLQFRGSKRRCYLPDTIQGRQVLRMLRVAFRHRLLFTVVNDYADWADGITHKTDLGYAKLHGYPDDTYLDRVTEELASFGITLEYTMQQYGGGSGSM